jgi:flagellar biosynthetic protein FliP
VTSSFGELLHAGAFEGRGMLKYLVLGLVTLLATEASAQGTIPILSAIQDSSGETEYSVTLQLLGLMTVLTLLPSILLMMTSFTRIIIVLSLLRQAMGTAQTPPNQILLGIALFLTIFIMAPVFTQVYNEAITPYSNDEIGLEESLELAQVPIKDFMLRQTREKDLQTFVSISNNPDISAPMDTPLSVLVPAFITSELKSAFTIGFMLYIPFIIIDMVVASVLMSMGMMMLSPMIISLPFKLLLFVMVDGWMLLMTSLTGSYV